jgi:effector-binding domain-containing protein
LPYPEVKSGRSKRTTVASVGRRGPYSGIGGDMSSLKRWIESNHVQESGHPFCMFYDNPLETPEGELRSGACIPVTQPFESEGRSGCRELPEVEVAETSHPGPPEESYKTYGPFLQGLLKAGYRLQGPAWEGFRSVDDVRGPGSGYLIRQPIAQR